MRRTHRGLVTITLRHAVCTIPTLAEGTICTLTIGTICAV